MIDPAFRNVAHEVLRIAGLGPDVTVSFELRRDGDLFHVRIRSGGWKDWKTVDQEFDASDLLRKKVPWEDSVGAKLCGMLSDLHAALTANLPSVSVSTNQANGKEPI